MKQVKFFLLSIFTLSLNALYSQSSADVFNTDELVYYGLDFSEARLIGNFGNGGGMAMKDKMFPQWNDVIAKEQEKFNLREVFRKNSIYYDLNPVRLANDETDANKILSLNENKLSAETIQDMVEKYKEGEKTSGTAVVFIVESFNKGTEIALIHVTFFDITTNKVLFTEPMQGRPVGVGLRNYWAGAVYDILQQITNNKYHVWKSKYK